MICNLEEFSDLIGPRIQKEIAKITRNIKISLDYECQRCGREMELDAVQKYECTRKDIFISILDNCKTSNGLYDIADVSETIEKIKSAHSPLRDYFKFLCKSCHIEYNLTKK